MIILGILLVLMTFPGTFELFLLTTAYFFPKRILKNKIQEKQKLTILVPAHNEAEGIAKTIESLLSSPGEKEIVVIADNCMDETASIAKAMKVRVLERNDSLRRGKPYALQFAFSKLLQEDHKTFAIVDADTTVAKNFVITLQDAFTFGGDAFQVINRLKAPKSIKMRLFELGFRAFNQIRPRGKQRLLQSCGILGNGFALTRHLLEQVPFDVEGITEDLAYHLKLILKGFQVQFVEETFVESALPKTLGGLQVQRARWEGGRLQTLREYGLPLLKAGAIEPLLDLLLLPLSYHFLLILLIFVFFPLFATVSLAIVSFHILLAILIGKEPLKDILAIFYLPYYLVFKLLLIKKISFKKEAPWERTPRS